MASGTSRGRKTAIILSTVALLTVAGGGSIYATGAWHSWQDDRSLSSACQGMLEYSEAKEMLGADRLRADGSENSTRCKVSDPGSGKASLDVRIQRSTDDARFLSRLDRADTHNGQQMVTPMGNGWAGVLNSSVENAHSVAWLQCQKQQDNIIVVSASAHRNGDAESFTTSEQKSRLARITTETLTNAAEKWGCNTKLGNQLEQVPTSSTQTLKGAGQATGTCKGIDSPSFESAVDGLAPVEDCILANKTSERQFRVSAYYGPFVKSARLETLRGNELLGESGGSDGLHWTTATCGQSTALYSVEPLDNGDGFVEPDAQLELQALKSFATQSAERHGCSAPIDPKR